MKEPPWADESPFYFEYDPSCHSTFLLEIIAFHWCALVQFGSQDHEYNAPKKLAVLIMQMG